MKDLNNNYVFLSKYLDNNIYNCVILFQCAKDQFIIYYSTFNHIVLYVLILLKLFSL